MFGGSIFYERRRVFWIETGSSSIDRATAALVAVDRARLLSEAKAGEGGVVDGDEVRFLREAARLAAVVSGQVPANEISIEGDNNPEGETARVLPFKVA